MSTSDSEKKLLLAKLRAQRAHVLGAVDGLDDATIRLAMLPSGWSFADLLSHLTWEDEKFWFGAIVAGDPDARAEFDGEPNLWVSTPGLSAAEILAAYKDACERSDEIIAATPLDAEPSWWPEELFGNWRLSSLREVMLHMITELATHAGHLDAARELHDGSQWMVLT